MLCCILIHGHFNTSATNMNVSSKEKGKKKKKNQHRP